MNTFHLYDFLFKRKMNLCILNFSHLFRQGVYAMLKAEKTNLTFFKKTLSQFFYRFTARTLILIEVGELYLMSP